VLTRAAVVLAALTALVAALAAPPARAADDPAFAAHLRSADWRPFSPASPFNRSAVGAEPLARSRRMVARMMSWDGPGTVVLGLAGGADDYGHPVYAAADGDPRVTLRATAPWGHNPLDGMRIPLPAYARAAGGQDAHLSVITPDGWEYDFWDVHGRRARGGVLSFGWGGRVRVDGDGLDGAATAAGFASLAGIVRPAELAAGRIDHALFLSVRCTTGHVWPARKGGSPCPEGRRDGPPMGARVRLALSPRRIAALPTSSSARVILTALATYGAYVGDTGSGSFGVQIESAVDALSRGQTDPFMTLARADGLKAWGGRATIDLAAGVDWARALRVVAPPQRAR
jgi:hypothetical protein